MKKIISLLGCCFIAISTLTACENNNLPAWADTDVLTPKAQTMIDTLNAFDYDGVAEIYNNPAVDASTFEASGEIIETYGTFESYGNVSYVADKTDDGIEFVRVIQIANYEKGKLTLSEVSLRTVLWLGLGWLIEKRYYVIYCDLRYGSKIRVRTRSTEPQDQSGP